MKFKIFRYFHTSVKMLMAIITLFQVHLSFEKKGLDSDIKWRKRATFGMWGLKNFAHIKFESYSTGRENWIDADISEF